MEEFLNKLFESRELAHALHLKTGKFAEHKALQDYYEGIVDLLDELTEMYQGQYGLVDLVEIQTMKTKVDSSKPLDYFEELVNFVISNKFKVISKEDTHLQNVVDEITGLLYKTIYKLKFLK